MNYSQLFSDCWAFGSSYLPLCGLPAWATALLPGFGGYETINFGHRRLRVLQKLGEGGYAVVLLVSELPGPDQPHPDPEPRALKKVLVQSGEHFDAVQQEMLIHSSVHHHPNILPLLDYCCSEGDPAAAATSPPRNQTPPTATATAAATAAGRGAHRSLDMGGFGGDVGPSVGRLGGPVGRGAQVTAGGGGGGGGGGVDRVACFLFPVFREGTLASELERLAARGEMLPTSEVLAVFLQMTRAAAHVHAHGYAHRDIKPLNVLVTTNPEHATQQRQPQTRAQALAKQGHGQGQEGPWRPGAQGVTATLRGPAAAAAADDVEAGEVLRSPAAGFVGPDSGAGPRYHCVLMDFGSARLREAVVGVRSQALALQEDAEAHCSAPYRAPELFDVPSPAALDLAAADVWALGASLFHLMYGEPPFQRAMNAAGGSLALAVLNCAIGWPRPGSLAYPPELHQLVMKAMQAEPADRPTASQLVDMVQALQLQHLPGPAPAQ